MKKLSIELTDNEYLLIKENAVKWNVPIEEYLAIAGRCYIDIVRRKREVLAENYHLKKEIERIRRKSTKGLLTQQGA